MKILQLSLAWLAIAATFGFGYALNSGTGWLWGSLGAGSVSVVGEGEPEVNATVQQFAPAPPSTPNGLVYIETAAGGHVGNLAGNPIAIWWWRTGDHDRSGVPDWHWSEIPNGIQ